MNISKFVAYATKTLLLFSLFSLLIFLLNPSNAKVLPAKYQKELDNSEQTVLIKEETKNEDIKYSEDELFPKVEVNTKSRPPANIRGKIIYLTKLPKCHIPHAIYQIEKGLDLFEDLQCPPATFKSITYDLNNDGQKEFIISNPDNNSQYWYFWRIYQYQKGSFKPIGEMACNAIRTTPNFTDGFQDIECYSYISMVEGEVKLYKHFGNEYVLDSTKKVNSKEFYP